MLSCFNFALQIHEVGAQTLAFRMLSDQSCKFWRYLRTYEMYVKSICSFLLLLKHKNQSFAISDLHEENAAQRLHPRPIGRHRR